MKRVGLETKEERGGERREKDSRAPLSTNSNVCEIWSQTPSKPRLRWGVIIIEHNHFVLPRTLQTICKLSVLFTSGRFFVSSHLFSRMGNEYVYTKITSDQIFFSFFSVFNFLGMVTSWNVKKIKWFSTLGSFWRSLKPTPLPPLSFPFCRLPNTS